MSVLITAFEPFGGSDTNMSASVLRLLPQGGKVRTLLLPVSYTGAFDVFRQYTAENPPKAVILTGQAPRSEISVERVAVNVGDCSLPDNDGTVMSGEPLAENAPAAYFSTLPIKAMAAAGGARISNTAGTYVCNALMYKALRLFDSSPVKCGFVHIPQEGDAQIFADALMRMACCLFS